MNIMLKQILKGLLRKHLDEFVEGAGDLNMAVDKGNIVLQKLMLKENAFEWTEMPLKVKPGSCIETLKLNIPWGKIKKKPTEIKADNVFLDLTMDWMDDAEKVLERMKSIKRRQLELYEIYEKELHEIPSIHSRAKSDSNISDAVSDNSSSTLAKPAIARGTTTTSVGSDNNKKKNNLVSSYLEAIADNLHVNITNLKIRYKEKGGIGFCIHLHSIIYQNCSASWTPVNVAYGDHDDSIYKVCLIKDFSLSFDDKHSSTEHEDSHLKQRSNRSNNTEGIVSGVKNKGIIASPCREYAIEPLSITARIQKNNSESKLLRKQSGLRDMRYKYAINIDCNRISVNLQQYQMKEIIRISDSINMSEQYVLHLFLQKFKPTKSPMKSPKAWWKYAFKYVRALIDPGTLNIPSLAYKKNKLSWKTLIKLILDQQRYVKFMKRKAGAPWLAKYVETAEVATLEDRFTFEQIVLFRRLAKAELEYERKTYDSKSHGTNVRKVLNVKRKKDKSKHIIKDHERLQLYAALQENEESAKQKREVVETYPFFNVKCNTKSIQLRLINENLVDDECDFDIHGEEREQPLKPFIVLDFGGLVTQVKFESQSNKAFIPGRRGPSLINLRCESLSCFGDINDIETPASSLIHYDRSTQLSCSELDGMKTGGVFCFRMEHFEESTNPIDVCIKGEAKSLEIFFEQNLLACLIDYLSNLSEDDSNYSAPRLSREVLVRQSRSQLQSTIEAHLRYDIDIKSGNIRVVVPSKITDSTSKTFVFNLGTLNFNSVPQENRKSAAATTDIVKSNKDMESITLTEKYILNTESLGIFYFCTLSEYRSADQCNFNQTNAVLEQFDLRSIVDISMVPDDDIVPWVETKSTLPTLHIRLSPDIIEGISNLHTQLIMKNQRDKTKDRSSSSVGAMPVGFKKLVGVTPPRNTSNSSRKHRLNLHGDLPSKTTKNRNIRSGAKSSVSLLGRIYFAHQLDVKAIDMSLRQVHDACDAFMPIVVNRIMLKSYIRIEDNLLECSIRDIEVTDKKIVDLWEDGSVFRVHNQLESNNEEKTNQDVEDISPAMYTSLFLCKGSSCNFTGYESNFDFNISNVYLNWNNQTLSRVLSVFTYSSTSDPSPISDTSQVNRILNKYASRANSTINRSASINISFFFDNIDANLVKIADRRCIVKLMLSKSLLNHCKMRNGNEHTISRINDFSILDTSISGMKECPTRTGVFKMLQYDDVLSENDTANPVEIFRRRKGTIEAILNIEIVKNVISPRLAENLDGRSQNHRDEVSIDITAGAFKFIVLNTLIVEVVDYIDEGITGTIASYVASEASAVIDEIYTRNQLVKVDANIDHPLIILPSIRHSYRASKDESLKLDLGQVKLQSKTDPEIEKYNIMIAGSPSQSPMRKKDMSVQQARNNGMVYDISVSNARLYSCAFNPMVQNWVDEVQMVDDFNATVELTVTPSGWNDSDVEKFRKKGYYVDGVVRKKLTWIFHFVTHIGAINGSLSQSQFANIENLLAWNLINWRQSDAKHATPFLPLFAESSQTESYRNIMDGRPVFLCLEFKVDKSKINLEGGFGKHIDGAPISPLFICEMSHINVKIENFIGRVIRNTVTGGSAILLDPRFQQKEGRISAEIFSTKSQNQNEEILPVLVEILRHPAGDKEHRINILNPKAVVHIFSAERLVDFFSNCHDFDSNERAFINNPNRSFASVFNFKISNAHVRLVECSPSDVPIQHRAATVFVGNINVTAAGNRELGIKVKCDTHNSKVLVQFEKSLTEHLIIKEVKCSIDFSQTVLSSSIGNFYWDNNEIINVHRQANVKISDIGLTIGVPHLLVMSNIFRTVNDALLTINESAIGISESPIKIGFSAIVNLTHARAIIVSDCYNKGNTIPILRLRISNCFLKMLKSEDDGSRMSLNFFDTSANHESQFTDSNSKLRTGISIYFYNTRVVTWEPLLEPWRFSVETYFPLTNSGRDLPPKPTDQKEKPQTLKLRSADDLCLNVSHSFLKSFKLWWDTELQPRFYITSSSNDGDALGAKTPLSSTARIEPSPTVHHEYLLENATGLPLKFALSYQEDSEMIRVENGESVPFSFPETLIHEHWYENPWANFHTTAIRVDWDIPSKPLEKVQIEKIGKYIYKLEPSTEVSGDSYTSELSQLFIRREWDLPEILCDISSKGGSLVVRLSALTRVVNNTSTALEVLLCGGPDAGIIQSLNPGSAISLPIHLQLHGRLTARPMVDKNNNLKEYGWWEGVDLFPLYENSSTNNRHVEKMLCTAMDSDDANLETWVSYVEFQKIKTADLKGFYFNLSFVSPLKLTNALPYPLYVKIRRGTSTRKEIFFTRMKSGETTHMNAAPLGSHDLLLVLSFNGIEWSDEEHVEPWIETIKKKSFFNKSIEKSVKRDPADSIYVPTREYDRSSKLVSMNKINVSLDNEGHGLNRKLTVYCKYWLINRSMLPLLFETPVKNAKKGHGKNNVNAEFSTQRRSRLRKNNESGKPSEIFSGILDDEMDNFGTEQEDKASSASLKNLKPILYSSADRLRVAIEGTSDFCKFFSINAVGTDGYISCVETQNSAVSRMLKSAGKRRGVTGYIGEDTRRRLFEFGVSLRIAPKIFKRTTMVVFSPRYVIVNRLRQPIHVTQANMQKKFTHTMTKKTVEEDILADEMITLEPNEGKPFHWFNISNCVSDQSDDLQLSFRLSSDGWRWSGGIIISDIRGMAIKLRNDITNTNLVARIEIKSEDTTSYILICEEDPEVPMYRIVNRSSEFIHFKQKQQKNDSNSYVVERIVPGDEKVFGWDEPCVEDRAMLISNSSGLGQIEYRLDEIRMKKFLYTANSGKIVSGSNKRKKKAKVSVFTEIHGPTKVLILLGDESSPMLLQPSPIASKVPKIEDETPPHENITSTPSSKNRSLSAHVSIYEDTGDGGKPRSITTPVSNNPGLDAEESDLLTPLPPSRRNRSGSLESNSSLQSSNFEQAQITASDYCCRSLTIGLQDAKICVIDAQPTEVVLISLVHVVVAHNTYFYGDNSVEVLIKDLQIDNQMSDTLFPVLLTPIPRQIKKKPFFHLSIAKPFVSENVDFYSYIAVLLQAFQVSIDQNSLVSIGESILSFVDIFDSKNTTADTSDRHSDNGSNQFGLRAHDLQLRNTLLDAMSLHKDHVGMHKKFHHLFNPLKQIYVQLMHLHPIKIRLKFAATRDSIRGQRSMSAQKEDILPPSVKSLLVDIDNAAIRMNAMLHTDVFVNVETLLSSIRNHYIGQARADLYRLIGAVDVLGNPVGFVRGLGTGMVDFFYEPAQGLVKSPGAFGLGVAKGTYSLVSGIVGGALHSASKLTGGVGSGIAQLSFDGDYKHKRKISKHVENPANVAEGVIYGTKAVGEGILLGVSGLVTQPYRGAKLEGAKGFLKGFAKGVIGVAVKPTVGVLDGASNITQGISGTATSLMSKPRITRLRRPRLLYSPDRILVIYREEEAFVKYLMENVESTKIDTKLYFAPQEYVTHVALPRARLMLVTRHLVSVWSCQTFLDGLDQSPNVSWITSLSHIKDLHIANNGKAVAIICTPKEVKRGINKGKKMSLRLLIPSMHEEITAAVLQRLHTITNQSKGL